MDFGLFVHSDDARDGVKDEDALTSILGVSVTRLLTLCLQLR